LNTEGSNVPCRRISGSKKTPPATLIFQVVENCRKPIVEKLVA